MHDWQAFVLGLVIIIGALYALLTTLKGLYFESMNSFVCNSTRDYCNNVVKTQGGNIFAIIALLPIVLLFYLMVSLIVSIRLLCGFGGGITGRHFLGAILGSAIGVVVVGIALLVCMDSSRLISVWWILGALASVVFFGGSGLSYPAPEQTLSKYQDTVELEKGNQSK